MLVHPDNVFTTAVEQHREVLRHPARAPSHKPRAQSEESANAGSGVARRHVARLSPTRS